MASVMPVYSSLKIVVLNWHLYAEKNVNNILTALSGCNVSRIPNGRLCNTIFTRSLPLLFAYNIFIGEGFGIQMLALGTLNPYYFGVKEFPKTMGFAIQIGTIIGGTGAPGVYFNRIGQSCTLIFC